MTIMYGMYITAMHYTNCVNSGFRIIGWSWRWSTLGKLMTSKILSIILWHIVIELIRGSHDTLWGCQQELAKWGRVEEERGEEGLRAAIDEVEAIEQLHASQFVVEEHQDTSVFRNVFSQLTSHFLYPGVDCPIWPSQGKASVGGQHDCQVCI